MEVNQILQNLIYLFNENRVRDSIMNRVLKKNTKRYIWKGTFMLSGDRPLLNYRRWKLINTKLYLFTVGYTYRGNSVHYVAFILDPKKKQLLCFDPGYNLYLYGTHKIIPMVVKQLTSDGIISNQIILKTKCSKKYYKENYGLQYNGKSPYKTLLPADAFCQTWTLYFLFSFVRLQEETSFFEEWCKIQPSLREFFIIQRFILPNIEFIPSFPKSDINKIDRFLLQQYWMKII
jgi:hypothetical protein